MSEPHLPSRPTAKMIRLYHHFNERFGGEPEDLWVFDPQEIPDAAPFLGITHVPVWPADAKCDVTSFQTLGMSNRRMKGADYFAELHFACRRPFAREERLAAAGFLANVATYPYQYDLKLDWWEVIPNVGKIPFFEGCKHLVLHPKMSPEGFDEIDDEEGKIKLLYLVPITPHERHLLVTHGRKRFLDHLAENEIDVLADRFDPPELSS